MKAITRKEKIMSGENLTPITRKEMFLAKAAGMDVEPPKPITREEFFLSKIGGGGTGGGGGSDKPVALAAGLYQTGAIALYQEQGEDAIEGMLITSWDELITSGAMRVKDGAVSIGAIIPENLPEKNEYGFYFGVAYTVGGWGYVFYEDGSVKEVEEDWSEDYPANTAVYSDNNIYFAEWGQNFTVSSDGRSLIDTESGGEFILGSTYQPEGDMIMPNDGSITNIGSEVFSYCTSLTSVIIPDSVTSIGEAAFHNCSSLTSVIIGNGVTSIGVRAFQSCSFTSITIPDSVTSIGDAAFEYCESLTNITFEGTVAQWNAIEKGNEWNHNAPATYVQCSDGQVAL